MLLNRCVEADLRDIAGSAPDTAVKVSMTVKRVVIVFAGGGSCLQFVGKHSTCEAQESGVCP